MAVLEFDDLSFEGRNSVIRAYFLKIFYFDIEKKNLRKISEFEIKKNKIEFKDINQRKAENKFNQLLYMHFNNLKNKLTGRKTVYIHKNSGIPLIGSIYFGLLDRNTNIIEIRPITGCNLNCIYCSVDEGKISKKKVDYVVEKDYLIDELRKIVDYKQEENLEAHINAQGEPLLYAPIVDLIKDIKKISQFKTISIDTNITLLNERLIDELIDAGLTRFNLSLNALNQKKASEIAGCNVNNEKIKKIIQYMAGKIDIIIAPIYLQHINEDDIEEIIVFVNNINKKIKTKKITIGIQNFLKYKSGRNPVKELKYDIFYERLGNLEKKYNIKLIMSESDFSIVKTKPLPKVFNKGDIVNAESMADGRLANEKLAVADDRVIAISNCHKTGKVKIKITRTKHNINYASLFRRQ